MENDPRICAMLSSVIRWLTLCVLMNSCATLFPRYPDKILVDSSNEAYVVYMSFYSDAEDAKEFIEKAAGNPNLKIITPYDFGWSPNSYFQKVIKRNDYGETYLGVGVVRILHRYANTPFGVTWNGGVALTKNDYEFALKRYENYKANPSAYSPSTVVENDPIYPKKHFDPLLGYLSPQRGSL